MKDADINAYEKIVAELRLQITQDENNYKAHEQRQLAKIKKLEEEVEKWKNKYIYALEKLLMR